MACSTAMHSLIGVGSDGRPRTPVLTYADSRATAQALRLRRDCGPDLYHRTGTPAHAMSPLAKLRWFRENQPDTCADVRRWLSLKEYLLSRLLGDSWVPLVDHSIASATGMFRLDGGGWDDEALEWAGVRRDALSTPVATRHVVSGIADDVARRLGLAGPVPVVMGAADGALANLGVGAVRPGAVAVTIGTSGAVRAVVDAPRTDARGRTFCYVLTADGAGEDRYVAGGAITNGGSVLAWLHRLLRDGRHGGHGGQEGHDDDDDIGALIELAADVPPGADGLLMLPYLDGERSPRWRSGLSGGLVGLRSDHGREHLVRAGLEGVLLQLGLVMGAVRDVVGASSDAIRATGGFTRSPLWTQMLADVVDQRLELATTTQASAYGAALLGMDALDVVESLDAAIDLVGVGRTVHPETESVQAYQRVADVYTDVVDEMIDGGVIDAVARLSRSL
jgi:gluconokinase